MIIFNYKFTPRLLIKIIIIKFHPKEIVRMNNLDRFQELDPAVWVSVTELIVQRLL